LIDAETHRARDRPRRYTTTEHAVTVPLDHAQPDGETIEVFARELCDVDKGW
jgi:hypothetical protein